MRWTTSWITSLLAVALAGLPAAQAQAPQIVIGAGVPQTGMLEDLGQHYARGILLWQDEVNAAGGLLGRKVDVRLRDDRSEAVRAGPVYRALIKEDNAEALIGPYGVAATLLAAAEAESARRVMVTGAGSSRVIHKRSPRYVFQAGIPYSAYGEGALAIAKERGLRRVYLIARDDPVAVEMAAGTRDAALAMGLEPGEIEVHATGLEDFAVQVARGRARNVEAWIAFGEVRDAAQMIKSFKRLDYAPPLFFARAASDARLIGLVGQDAEMALGALAWGEGLPMPDNARFVTAFTTKYGARPTLAAAQGYAAATVLGEAIRRAGGPESDKLRAVLGAQAIPTVLGEYKVDPRTNEETAAAPALTQIQKGRAEVVWPPALRTSAAVLPYADWHERRPLK